MGCGCSGSTPRQAGSKESPERVTRTATVGPGAPGFFYNGPKRAKPAAKPKPDDK